MLRSPVRPGLALGLLALLPLVLAPHDAFAKKKKEVAPAAPKEGWVQEGTSAMSCYYPPNWESMQEIDRRQARAKVLTELEKQWSGARNDGISFSEGAIEDVDTTLLGRPELIEGVSAQNLTLCQGVAAGQATADQWQAWLKALPGKLTAGECLRPLDYTMFDYLDIGVGWQRPLSICKGDKIRVSGTPKDKYRVRDDGPWINVGGDTTKPTTGADWPCNVEGCFEGMLVMKFVTLSGVETIIPVGTELTWTAPEHGEITYRINDTTLYDNNWFKSGSMQDRTAIEIAPAE